MELNIKGQMTIFDFLPRKQDKIQPTFLVYYYQEQAARLTWIRAKDKDAAIRKFHRTHGNCKVKDIQLSNRSIEELNALE
ncbi:hypothetical protein [Ectobacillus ponti]|uniref:Uncharacterized protein n=1 Tax=Ectobacillus ponti TaxID=2961894 RepID=A0AA42BQR5_9BACI|nr:hypothetical protein [Ectobacillus ponti]MCP8970555.1 hypothetical protein [Ectobacillus ponti]